MTLRMIAAMRQESIVFVMVLRFFAYPEIRGHARIS